MSACVIDASAVLAHLLGERGGDVALSWIDRGAAISTANAQEVLARLVDLDIRNGRDPEKATSDAARDFADLNLAVFDLTLEDAIEAASLAPLQRSHGMSAGDRCCLALGRRLGLPVVHAEQRWQPLEESLGQELVLVREARTKS